MTESYGIPEASQERIGQKIAGVMTLELAGAGHRSDLVTSECLVRRSIADHPAVFPRP